MRKKQYISIILSFLLVLSGILPSFQIAYAKTNASDNLWKIYNNLDSLDDITELNNELKEYLNDLEREYGESVKKDQPESSSGQQENNTLSEQYVIESSKDLLEAQVLKSIEEGINKGEEDKYKASALVPTEPGESSSLVDKVEIENINAKNYPNIEIIASIKDKAGNSLDSIEPESFNILEKNLTSSDPNYKRIDESNFSIEKIGGSTTKADIVFIVDTTASMSNEIANVRDNLLKFTNSLLEQKINFRLAGFSYGDEVPYRSKFDFTNEFETVEEAEKEAEKFKEWIKTLTATGGDDIPENPLDSIIATKDLEFRSDAQQIVMLITDAPAHVAGDGGNSLTSATLSQAYEALKGRTFYFTAPNEYSSQYSLLGNSLGERFDANVLLNKFVKEISARYVIKYTSPYPKDNSVRRSLIQVTDPYSEKKFTDSAEYTLGDLATIKGKIDLVYDEGVTEKVDESIVTITNEEAGFSLSVKADSSGSYEFKNVPVGSYKVEAFIPALTGTITKEVTLASEEVETIDFTLYPLKGKELKEKLISEIKKYSEGYYSGENEVQKWLDSLSDEELTQSEVEAVMRLLWAETILSTSLPHADHAAEVFAKSLGSLIGQLAGGLKKLDFLKKTLAKQGLDPNDIENFEQIRDGIGSLLKNIIALVGDLAKSNPKLAENEAFDETLDYLKSFVGSIFSLKIDVSDATGVITKHITENITKPYFVNQTAPYITDTLSFAQNVADGSPNVSGYNNDIKGASDVIAKLINENNKLASTVQKLDGLVKIVKTIRAFSETVELVAKIASFIPVAGEVAAVVYGFCESFNKMLDLVEISLTTWNGIAGGERFGELPYEVRDGMYAVFDSNGRYTISSKSVNKKLSYVSAESLFNNSKYAIASSATLSSELEDDFTSYLSSLEELKKYISESAEFNQNSFYQNREKLMNTINHEVEIIKSIAFKNADELGVISSKLSQYRILLENDNLSISTYLLTFNLLSSYIDDATGSEVLEINQSMESIKEEILIALDEHEKRINEMKDLIIVAKQFTSGYTVENVILLDGVNVSILPNEELVSTAEAGDDSLVVDKNHNRIKIVANIFNASSTPVNNVEVSLALDEGSFTSDENFTKTIEKIEPNSSATTSWIVTYNGKFDGTTRSLTVNVSGSEINKYVDIADLETPTVSFNAEKNISVTDSDVILTGTVSEPFSIKSIYINGKELNKDDVSIDISYDKGYNFRLTFKRNNFDSSGEVILQDFGGNEVTIPFSYKGRNTPSEPTPTPAPTPAPTPTPKDKKLSLINLSTIPANTEMKITDIDNHWAEDAIKELASKNIVKGWPNGEFRPDNKITRGEAITIISRIITPLPDSLNELTFKDNIPKFAVEPVRVGVTLGIIEGFPDNTFRAGSNITRAETAAILNRLLKKVEYSAKKHNNVKFVDNLPKWAESDIIEMANFGIINGYKDGRFRPNQHITRAEFVVMVLRILDGSNE